MTQVPPPPSEEASWYYMGGTQRLGPVTTTSLIGLIQNGALDGSTMVWKNGMSAWTPVGMLPEFAFIMNAARTKEAALGLTTGGLVVFILLVVCCLPLCWLPWVIPSLKAK